MADRVTNKESQMVQRIENIQDFLKPLEERYGKKESAKVEKLITIQARMGIQRKLLDKHTDERMKRSAEEQINKLREEMEKVRKEIGTYAMLQLRHTIPEETSPVWTRLGDLIQERASAPQAGRANLWDNLKARQTQAAESKQESKS
jgi:hypothetical protein